jgi:hypothetical protein
MFVRGVDANGQEFIDLAKTVNISGVGASLAIARPVRISDILTLTVPAPPPSPSGTLPGSTPPMQARVRRRQSAGDVYLCGVEFLKPLD